MTETDKPVPVAQSDEFAAAMQQLSAEAAKNLPAPTEFFGDNGAEPNQSVLREVKTRLENFEKNLAERLDKLATEVSTRPAELAQQFARVEDQLAAIYSTESVNQQLFDSLHAELLKYRDNFLHESLQKPFIHDLVLLYDDLNALAEQLRSAAQEKNGKHHIGQWRDNLENAIHSLVEILHRFEVCEIEPKERVDRSLHKVINFEPADYAEEDGCIVMRVKRGFVWRGKLVRPEEVIAKRFG
jgi:molecular chaperone GrpE (heat shock protein)